MSLAQKLVERWQALDRHERVALVGMVALVAGAIGVRVWFMVSYSTAFLGYPDASQYALAADLNIFRDPLRPAGYPLFLRLVHHFGDTLSFAIAVQHVLGIATGVLLYKGVRRTGAPPWLGLLPAAVAFFEGSGLFLEHSLLADSLFVFLQAVAVYMAIRALYDARLRWPLLAGMAIGVSIWVRGVGITNMVVISTVLLCGAPGNVRRRLLSAATVALVSIGLIVTYIGVQYGVTGYFGYQRQNAWNLYARVATFVDCSKFTPPSGTAFLCPSQPLGHRLSPGFYQSDAGAPPVDRFGPPWEAPLYANGIVQRFAISAIEHEPVAYAKAILRGLSFYVFPRVGEGYIPEELHGGLINPARARAAQSEIALFYPHSVSYSATGDVEPLVAYERHTRIQGPLLIVMLVAAIAGLFLLPSPMRWAAAIFTFTAILSITFAVATVAYDARYAYPTFAPLAAGAALGGWGICRHLMRMLRRRTEGSGGTGQ
ncbi:MAG TPA: glycosyltransferase family 39 protein [Solirubrobacteraceae bacterium]|nr:glycosyltransferase family 39 protein [Solirubrobacteraceae bacterium]